MSRIFYEDFDLLIQTTGAKKSYQVRVLKSPAGEATTTFRLPFAPGESEVLLASWNSAAGDIGESSHAKVARELGERLFSSAFSGQVAECFRVSLAEMAGQKRGLRIRLRLNDAPELAALPWECLYDPVLKAHHGLSINTPIVRYLDLHERARSTVVTPPLRLHVMISSPRGYPSLDVEREWMRLRDALSPLEERGLVALERSEGASLSRLQQRLRQGDCHILHFIGHGDFDVATGEGILLMENEERSAHPVSQERLGALLRDHKPMSLVVLNACDGSRASGSDVFSGLAQGLVRCGVPAVIAMQFQITDDAAITFAREFYASVADGYPVDAATTESRKAIFGEGNALEWATPVLFMRSPDGRVFEVGEVSEEARTQVRVAALLRDASLMVQAADWAPAIENLHKLLLLEQGHAEATSLLVTCKHQRELQSFYTAGKQQFENERWAQAVDFLTRARSNGARHEDLATMLDRAHQELRKKNPQLPSNGGGTTDFLETHCKLVSKALIEGRVVPFLGKGANLCGRPPDARWKLGGYAPSGDELAEHLAMNFGYPLNDERDLLRVSQYISVTTGSGPLYDELHTLFDIDFKPTPLHEFFARMPSVLRSRGSARPYQLIVTSNYDDVLERAFLDAGEPFDLVCYAAEGENRGKFLHKPPGGGYLVIERENEYRGLCLDERSVILKIHGAIDRFNADQDSYVITEDHNIDYLTRTSISSPVPVVLQAKLKKSQFLFFGSSLRDWNLRVFLHRIWGERSLTYRSWAVQHTPQGVDRDFWGKRDVDIVEACSEQYIDRLRERLMA